MAASAFPADPRLGTGASPLDRCSFPVPLLPGGPCRPVFYIPKKLLIFPYPWAKINKDETGSKEVTRLVVRMPSLSPDDVVPILNSRRKRLEEDLKEWQEHLAALDGTLNSRWCRLPLLGALIVSWRLSQQESAQRYIASLHQDIADADAIIAGCRLEAISRPDLLALLRDELTVRQRLARHRLLATDGYEVSDAAIRLVIARLERGH